MASRVPPDLATKGELREKTNRIFILEMVKRAAKKKLLFLPHAVKQMSHPDRMISVQEVRRVILQGEIIED